MCQTSKVDTFSFHQTNLSFSRYFFVLLVSAQKGRYLQKKYVMREHVNYKNFFSFMFDSYESFFGTGKKMHNTHENPFAFNIFFSSLSSYSNFLSVSFNFSSFFLLNESKVWLRKGEAFNSSEHPTPEQTKPIFYSLHRTFLPSCYRNIGEDGIK